MFARRAHYLMGMSVNVVRLVTKAESVADGTESASPDWFLDARVIDGGNKFGRQRHRRRLRQACAGATLATSMVVPPNAG